MWLCVQIVLFATVEASKILFISPSPALSHNLFYQPIVKELAHHGHNLTFVAGDLIPNNNNTQIQQINIRSETYGAINLGETFFKIQQEKPRRITIFHYLTPIVTQTIDLILSNPEIQALRTQDFDLVIFEHLNYPILMGLKHWFNCPMIGISSLDLMIPGFDSVGSATFPSYYADYWMNSGPDLTFWERMENFIYAIEYRWFYFSTFMGQQQVIFDKHFKGGGSLLELEREIDLVIVNSNPIFHNPKPTVPAIVEIGGLHYRESEVLTKELQQYLDSAPKIIYFSLGSNIKSKSLPKAKFDAILSTFSKLPYQILWKWESDNLLNKPSNVHIKKWLPQQAVLQHPNVKAFVTQGGLQSIEEAIRGKVPMLAIPFGGDQEYNAGRIESRKIGLCLQYDELNEQRLSEGLIRIIEDPIFMENVVKMSGLLWDQPIKPMDKATWWIEYVIRHKGAKHLRSPAVDMSWFKLLSLDVISFLVICLLIVVLFIVFILKLIFKALKHSKKIKTN